MILSACMHKLPKFGSLVLILLGAMTIESASFADETKTRDESIEAYHARRFGVDPQELYLSAWRLVRDGYYHKDYDGQHWKAWQNRFEGKLKTVEDAQKAIETMLASLNNPDTKLIKKSDTDPSDEQPFGGVGLMIEPDIGGKMTVAIPMEQSPAKMAGVKAGWIIERVDGESMEGKTPEYVSNRIRGPLKTAVTVDFICPPNNRTRLELQRQELPFRAITYSTALANKIGYIRLESLLDRRLAKEMREKLLEYSKTKALILDLRDNDAGLFTNAVDLANLFVKSGPVFVSMDGEYENVTEQMQSPVYSKPLVVLINKRTAKAAEMLAAALSESGEAFLVGERTCGHTLINYTTPLLDGSQLVVSIARALTPVTRKEITGIGIAPNRQITVSDRDFVLQHGGPWWIRLSTNEPSLAPTILDKQLATALDYLKERGILGDSSQLKI